MKLRTSKGKVFVITIKYCHPNVKETKGRGWGIIHQIPLSDTSMWLPLSWRMSAHQHCVSEPLIQYDMVDTITWVELLP